MRFLMRLRAWTGIVAAMAVFWHGVLLVRHSLAMADALRHHRALLADMTSLCRTRPGETSNAATDLPPMPLPSAPRPDDAAGCLMCAGLVGAVLPTPRFETLPAPAAPAVGSAQAEAQRVSPLQIAHPLARGPPLAA
jgi:hypothetical protein